MISPETISTLDIIIKGFGLIGIMIGGIVGLYRFADLKEREFYSQFWNERLRLYIKMLDTAAKISAVRSEDELAQTLEEFWVLFDGSMAVVQDATVDRAMHKFADQVRLVEQGKMDRKDLGIQSYRLGRICFNSLSGSWNKPFSSLASTATQQSLAGDWNQRISHR